MPEHLQFEPTWESLFVDEGRHIPEELKFRSSGPETQELV